MEIICFSCSFSFWSKRLSEAIQFFSWSTKSWIFSFVKVEAAIVSVFLSTNGIAVNDDETWSGTLGAIVDEKWGTIEDVVVDGWGKLSINDPESICESYY